MTTATVRRVLVGVDFDDSSAAALQMAAALARPWGAELTVFHAASEEQPAYFTASQIDQLEAERERSRAVLAGQLRVFAGRHAGGNVNVVVGDGLAQDAIVRLAPAFDMVVVGTHRRHGVPRWWLGSVAEAIVRQSPRPVLVVPSSPALRRRPTIVAVGSEPVADRWVEVLRAAIGGDVLRVSEVGHCTPDRLGEADVIVFPVSTSERLNELGQVLKECRHPVLFLPSEGVEERTPS